MTALRLLIEPRGLQREIAARYVGISASKFDSLVNAGRMPRPKLIDRRKIWDRLAIDDAIDALPTDADANPWDEQPSDAT